MTTFEDLGINTKPGQRRYATICPNCNNDRQKHKNALCLTVNDEPDNRWYKCHHCGWSGNLDITDKYNQVREKSRMPKEIPSTFSKVVRDYLESERGISQKVALKEQIFEFSNYNKPVLGFPFYVGVTLVNVKYFNLSWTPEAEFPKWYQMNKDLGTRSIFLGMQSITFEKDGEMSRSRKIIITEGEWDFLTYKQCGYNNVLSIPMGAPSLEAKNFEHEFDYANDPYVKSFFSPENVDTIIFSGDDDAPGRKCRDHLALIFGRERCKYVNYPVGYKDINEVYWGSKKKGLPKLGKEGVDKCIVDLSTFKVSGVIRPSDVRNELIEYATKGFTPGLGIGVPEVDKLYTLKPKHITMSTGLPGSGKSTYWRWYLSEFVRHNIDLNIKWAMFTPENRPVAREYAKIAEVTTGQAFKEGLPNSMSQSLREATLSFIEKHFFIIAPNKKNFEDWNGKIKPTGVNTMTSLLEYIIYLKKTENIFGYIIDAWNKIEHEQSKYISDTNFISSQLDYLIELNDLYDLHGIVIVHPTKMELVGANFRIPTLYDCKGSSAWKEKADIGVIIHRNKIRKKKKDEIPVGADEDDKYEVNLEAPTILKCEKLRFEELGVEGKIKLSMDYKKGNRFYPVKVEPKPEALKSQTRYDGPQTAETDESFELKPMEDLPF